MDLMGINRGFPPLNSMLKECGVDAEHDFNKQGLLYESPPASNQFWRMKSYVLGAYEPSCLSLEPDSFTKSKSPYQPQKELGKKAC